MIGGRIESGAAGCRGGPRRLWVLRSARLHAQPIAGRRGSGGDSSLHGSPPGNVAAVLCQRAHRWNDATEFSRRAYRASHGIAVAGAHASRRAGGEASRRGGFRRGARPGISPAFRSAHQDASRCDSAHAFALERALLGDVYRSRIGLQPLAGDRKSTRLNSSHH